MQHFKASNSMGSSMTIPLELYILDIMRVKPVLPFYFLTSVCSDFFLQTHDFFQQMHPAFFTRIAILNFVLPHTILLFN